jgi:hypothetical protein
MDHGDKLALFVGIGLILRAHAELAAGLGGEVAARSVLLAALEHQHQAAALARVLCSGVRLDRR